MADVWELKDVIGQGVIRLIGAEVTLDIGALFAGLDQGRPAEDRAAPS